MSPSLDGFFQVSIEQITDRETTTTLLGFIQAGPGDKLVPIHFHHQGHPVR